MPVYTAGAGEVSRSLEVLVSSLLFATLRVSQPNDSTRKTGSARRGRPSRSSRSRGHLPKSWKSNGGLPRYTPQSDSPPPAYDSAVQRHGDRPTMPSMFRKQNLPDICHTNVEPYVPLINDIIIFDRHVSYRMLLLSRRCSQHQSSYPDTYICLF